MLVEGTDVFVGTTRVEVGLTVGGTAVNVLGIVALGSRVREIKV